MTNLPRSPRFSVRFQVVFDDGQSFMSGPVISLSESGMFIETVMPPQPGTPVRITPLLPEHAGLFELEGVVVRKEEYDGDNIDGAKQGGFGVRFSHISSDAKKQLHTLFEGGRAR